jgi:hypothetical protein
MFGSIVIKPDILYLYQSKKKNPLLVSNCIIAKIIPLLQNYIPYRSQTVYVGTCIVAEISLLTSNCREKVTTMKITTSKAKKNIKKSVDHHFVENHFVKNVIESQKLPIVFSPYEIRLKKCHR